MSELHQDSENVSYHHLLFALVSFEGGIVPIKVLFTITKFFFWVLNNILSSNYAFETKALALFQHEIKNVTNKSILDKTHKILR